MNNLTNEERARIFAMYMPCEVIISNNVVCTAIGVSHIGKGNILVPTKGDVDDYAEAPLSMTQLLLTPLSKITDEHAIEIANIVDVSNNWVIENI